MAPAVRPHPLRTFAVSLLAVVLLGCAVAASTGTARGSSPTDTIRRALSLPSSTVPPSTAPTGPATPPPTDDDARGVAGGVVADGHLSPFADVPAVTNLDPDLRAAVQAAARAADDDGVRMYLTSGWRSRAYQRALLDAAIVKYGSERQALRYVATPDASHHVTGDAVDVGPTRADDWLQRHGADFGLCRTYANELWHFELATSRGGTCPRMLPDASAG